MGNPFEKYQPSEEEITKAKDIMNDETMKDEQGLSARREKEYEIFESTGASPELLGKCKLSYEAGNLDEGGIGGEIDGNIIKVFKKNYFGAINKQGHEVYRYEGEINGNKIEDEEDAKKLYIKYVEVAKMQSGEHSFEAVKKLDKELIDKLISL